MLSHTVLKNGSNIVLPSSNNSILTSRVKLIGKDIFISIRFNIINQ